MKRWTLEYPDGLGIFTFETDEFGCIVEVFHAAHMFDCPVCGADRATTLQCTKMTIKMVGKDIQDVNYSVSLSTSLAD